MPQIIPLQFVQLLANTSINRFQAFRCHQPRNIW